MKEVYKALAAAMQEFDAAVKDFTNPHFGSDYASLASYKRASDAALFRHNLIFIQVCKWVPERSKYVVEGSVFHWESGEESKPSEFPMEWSDRAPNLMQAAGAAYSYARRFNREGALDISRGSIEDDGESAFPREKAQESEKAEKKPYQLRQVQKPSTQEKPESFIAVDFEYFNGMTSDEILAWGKDNSARMSEKDLTKLRTTIKEKRTIEHTNKKLLEKRAAIATNSVEEPVKVQGEVS